MAKFTMTKITMTNAVLMREIGKTMRGKELLNKHGSNTAEVIAEFKTDLPDKFAAIYQLAADEIREQELLQRCLSTDPAIVTIRKECATYLVRIKDKLSEDEKVAVNLPYLEEHGDFETEAIYQTAKKISETYNTPDLDRGDVLDILVKVTRDGEEYEKVSFNHYRAANAILQKLPVVMSCDDDKKLYYWNGQIWQPNAEDVLYNKMKVLAKKHLNRNQHQEVITAIKHALILKRVKLDPDPYLLGVKNGVVELATGTFRGYRKEDYITDQIDVLYDPMAKCPVFFDYLETSVPRIIDRFTLIDWFTLHAIKEMFPYIMFLLGRGRNGKGMFEGLLRKFYGNHAFSGVSFEELNDSRFAGIGLLNKRGQIVGEGGKDRGEGKKTLPTAYAKNATGGGIIDTDRKNQDRLVFLPFYKSTVDTNDMPYIRDTTIGMTERFCKVDFPYVFVDNPQPNTNQRQIDTFLEGKMQTPQELSGILNLIVARAPEIIKTKRITRRDSEEMAQEYAKQSNSVSTFLDDFCNYDPLVCNTMNHPPFQRVYNDVLYERYKKWCELLNGDIVNDQRFGTALKRFCNLQTADRTDPEIDAATGKQTRHRYQKGLSFDQAAYDAVVPPTMPPATKTTNIETTEDKNTNTTDLDRPTTDLIPTNTVTVPSIPTYTEITWSILKKDRVFPTTQTTIDPNISEETDKTPCKFSIERITPQKQAVGLDSDSKNTVGTAIGDVGLKSVTLGLHSDLSGTPTHSES